jgi:hypothetical protein
MQRSVKVRLKVELTKHDSKLKAGVEGLAVGEYGLWSRGSDRFTGVYFPEIGTFDILWESLAIIDEEYLYQIAERDREERELLKCAKNVFKIIGPRGGFRRLSYEYLGKEGVPCHVSTCSREESDRLITIFGEYGIPVQERIE